ncbi:MAG: Smr/MutS family protein [Pseudomonadota bacterium]|nr:Smr/MutS family protein [Pseudomonadota bacterium]
MAKKKIRKIRPQIRFEIEENAEQLMLEADVLEFAGDKDLDADDHGTSKRSYRREVYELDLHGLTLSESQQRIDSLFQRILRTGQRTRVKIITGKGRHSRANTNLLARDVHIYVRQRYAEHIVSIEQSPDAVRVGGMPIRGHFEVIIQ